MSERLQDRIVGRWTEILPLVGVPVKCLDGKNQPCPLCGGKDRFRMFKRNEGVFVCTHCGIMNGITLAMRLTGTVEFKDMARRIEAHIGVPPPPQPRERTDFEKRKALNDLWNRARPVDVMSPAGRYLTGRTGITDYPRALRMVDELRYWTGDNSQRVFYPALLAKVCGPNGRPVNIYRTYLTTRGQKAPVDSPRRMMPGSVPKGSTVRLGEPGRALGVAEGIETAISASLIYGVPTWAVLGTAGMASWIPPAGVERVLVFGDNDEGYAGQAAAYAAGFRLSALPGRKLEVEVLVPGHETSGRDWNDVHQEGAAGAAGRPIVDGFRAGLLSAVC